MYLINDLAICQAEQIFFRLSRLREKSLITWWWGDQNDGMWLVNWKKITNSSLSWCAKATDRLSSEQSACKACMHLCDSSSISVNSSLQVKLMRTTFPSKFHEHWLRYQRRHVIDYSRQLLTFEEEQRNSIELIIW